MAVTFRSAASNGVSLEASSAALVVNKPTGAVAGDALVAFVGWVHSGGTAAAGTCTPPAGWVSVRKAAGSGSVRRQCESFVRVAEESEPASYSFTVTGAGAATKIEAAGGILAFQGANVAGPINVHGSAEFLSGENAVAPSVTTTVNDCLVVECPAAMSANRTFTAPAGTTEIWDTGAGASIGTTAARDNATIPAGASGTRSFSLNATAAGTVQTLAIAPAVEASSRARLSPTALQQEQDCEPVKDAALIALILFCAYREWSAARERVELVQRLQAPESAIAGYAARHSERRPAVTLAVDDDQAFERLHLERQEREVRNGDGAD